MSAVKPSVRKLQPLRPPVFHILLVLADGDRHGYAIKKQVESETDGLVKMGPGTLYESIQRMVEHGLIEESMRRRTGDPDQAQRRYYAITRFGKEVLRAEVARMETAVRAARASLRRARSA